MNAIIGKLPSGSGMRLIRIHDGVVCVVEPETPIVGEDPSEICLAVAVWLGMRKPRKSNDEDPWRYAWAAPRVLCPIGAQFMIAKVERASAHGPAYILTNFVDGSFPVQLTAWNPMGVLTHVHSWLTSCALNPQMHLHAIRVEQQLDPEADDTFLARIATTVTLAPEDGAPNPQAPLTLLAADPNLRVGIVSESIVDHVNKALAGESEGFFIARLRVSVLEIGQRIDPDVMFAEGEDDEDDDEA